MVSRFKPRYLHELFNARLFSIHPDTLRVRAFVPYDLILEHHGSRAHLPPNIDRRALGHHYEMCCIENMTAVLTGPIEQPPSLPGTPFSRMGSASSLGSGSHTPAAPGSRHDSRKRLFQHGRHGNQAKTPRSEDNRSCDTDQPMDQPHQPRMVKREAPISDDETPDAKRWRPSDEDEELEYCDCDGQGYVTPCDHEDSLSSVNWTLVGFR
ncbi:hypothetical protein LCI18_015301 [Fusarium solani-melongenae]|uniref:Uncharacterized protein n=1 Tax=Fusarium solani subsp. cucurbitae TaxID=2747967 RepID=A0ACD3ZT30_FUSSC|nr:hypothetical protein LCI18_015301 [Fusarium solani-melongenae]